MSVRQKVPNLTFFFRKSRENAGVSRKRILNFRKIIQMKTELENCEKLRFAFVKTFGEKINDREIPQNPLFPPQKS